jgi:hypothetical protein
LEGDAMPIGELNTETTLTGIQAHWANTDAVSTKLQDKDGLIFDTVIKQSDDIRLNKETGIFEILLPGSYLVIWGAAVCGCESKPFMRFTLAVGGADYESSASSSLSCGFVSGASIITAAENPTAVSLFNDTGEAILLSDVQPVAYITITRLAGPSREDSISSLISSIAIQKNAMAQIMVAESEKIRAAIKIPGVTIEDLISINNSVENNLNNIVHLEGLLVTKLETILSEME